MTVSYSRRSLAQIAEIIAFLAVDDARTSSAFSRRIEALAALLGRHPHIGRQTNIASVRVLPAKPYPYLIFYELEATGTGITVLRVRHMSRNDDWRRGR